MDGQSSSAAGSLPDHTPGTLNGFDGIEKPQSSTERTNNGDSEKQTRHEDSITHTEAHLAISRVKTVFLVLTVTGAAFLNTYTVQAVVIILPIVGEELEIPDGRLQWIVSAYSLTFGCFLLLWGRLADVYGKKLIFVCGSAWLTITSVIVPLIENEVGLDVMRALQGLGGAANVPTAIGILGVTFPPGKAKNYAFACYGAGAPLGAIIGNIAGGVIAQYLSWKWVFWILSFLAAFVTIAGYFIIPATPVQERPRGLGSSVDWVGAIMITSGLVALMFALIDGNIVGWNTVYIPILIVISVFIILLFGLWQWRLEVKGTKPPLMKISIFKNFQFTAAMVVMALFFASFNNFLIFASLYYQKNIGLSVLDTTLRFIPTGVAGLIVAFCTGKLLGVVNGIYILIFGTICSAISSLLMAVPIPPSTTYWAFGFPAMVLSVCGADTLYPSLTLFTAHSLPQEDQALGGALINVASQLGRAIGLAIATATETAVIARVKGLPINDVGTKCLEPGDTALPFGLRAANWLDVALALVAFLVVVAAFRNVGKLGARN